MSGLPQSVGVRHSAQGPRPRCGATVVVFRTPGMPCAAPCVSHACSLQHTSTPVSVILYCNNNSSCCSHALPVASVAVSLLLLHASLSMHASIHHPPCIIPCLPADLAAIAERMSKVKNKLLVLSGKGGVGKSTFATQLAFALAAQGKEVSERACVGGGAAL